MSESGQECYAAGGPERFPRMRTARSAGVTVSEPKAAVQAPTHRRAAGKNRLPESLLTLLSTPAEARDGAWEAFVSAFSGPILRTVYTRCSDYDSAMDRYAFVLEKLQEDDCRRLRRYTADGRAQFHTWLAVVTRRLCEDYRRQRYGRPQSHTPEGERRAREQFKIRSLLADLSGTDQDWSRLPTPGDNPEVGLREAELHGALTEAVQELEPQDQLLIRLRFEYDLTAKQIARLMDFPTPFHVYRRLRSRLDLLRTALRERGHGNAVP